MKICPHCNQSYPNPNARFCPHCGKGLAQGGAQPNPHVTTPMARAVPTRLIPADQTQPPSTTPQLGAAARAQFGALPAGELIGPSNQRYEILESLEESPNQFNLYRVKAHRLRACEHCQTANPIDSKFCGQCGAARTVEPAQTFRLQEAAQEAIIARKISVIKQGLFHAGFVNSYAHFVDQWFDNQPRYYVVMDDIPAAAQGRTLAALAPLQPTAKVLQWGSQIADAR